jgi:hypothetical protein
VALLRLVAVLALVLWIGGLAMLGGVGAPVLFEVLQSEIPVGGRELAARVFGVMLIRAQYVSWACGLVFLTSLGIRAALGPRPRRFGIRMWIAAAMLAASVATTYGLAPRIEGIRTSVSGPVAGLPDDDPRKVTFGRLHGFSNLLMGGTLIAGLALLWFEIRERG